MVKDSPKLVSIVLYFGIGIDFLKIMYSPFKGMSSITNIRPPIARRDPSPNRQGLGVLSVKELVSPTPSMLL